jgi:CheY-like chemotaxis protein
MRGEPDPPPSARVRLEVAFLDDGESLEAVPEIHDGRPRLKVLVVAAEADVRRYIGECLRSIPNLNVLEAASASAAAGMAEQACPDLMIVDESEIDVADRLPRLRAIAIVDEIPYGGTNSRSRIRLLGRPFSAEQLMIEVEQSLTT